MKKFSKTKSDYDWLTRKDIVNHSGNKPFKLTFLDKVITTTKNGKVTICTMKCKMVWSIPPYLLTDLTQWDINNVFEVKGVSVCHENDEFDFSKGAAIAATRAENNGYKEALRRLYLLYHQTTCFAKALSTAGESLVNYLEHNDTFLTNVLSGEQKVERYKQ